MPSSSAPRPSLPALLLLSVLAAGAVLAIIGLFPVLAVASTEDKAGEVPVEAAAPAPGEELPAVPSASEQEPDDWQRTLGEIGQTPEPPTRSGSNLTGVTDLPAEGSEQPRQDLITATAPVQPLVENKPVTVDAQPADEGDGEDPEDEQDKDIPPPTLEGAREYWHQKLDEANAEVGTAQQTEQAARAYADDVGAWGNLGEIIEAKEQADDAEEAKVVAAEDVAQASDSAYAYDVMAAMHGVAADAEAADDVTWSRYDEAKDEEWWLRAKMAKDLAAANNIPDPGERAAARNRLAVKQAELDVRWAVTDRILQHHENMIEVPAYAATADREAEQFRISAWHANERERVTRERAETLDASLRASTRDTYYLEDAKQADALWAEEGARAREKELGDVRAALDAVRHLLTDFRPSKAPDLAERYGLGEDGDLANWRAGTVKAAPEWLAGTLNDAREETVRYSASQPIEEPELRDPEPMWAGYARSRDPITVMEWQGPGGARFVATGDDLVTDTAGHELRRGVRPGQVVSSVNEGGASVFHLDGVEAGSPVRMDVPDFSDAWSGHVTVMATSGAPVSLEIPRTLHPDGDPLGMRQELAGFTILIPKSHAEMAADQTGDPAWRATYTRISADVYAPDARAAGLIREHPELGLPVTVSRVTSQTDGNGLRQVQSREGEEILRVTIGNARWNTLINPDWEHVPATGHEDAVNLSAGHEAGR